MQLLKKPKIIKYSKTLGVVADSSLGHAQIIFGKLVVFMVQVRNLLLKPTKIAKLAVNATRL